MPILSCLYCGADFYAKPARIKAGYGKYCSNSCTGKSRGRGQTKHPLYAIWQGIRRRCNCPTSKDFVKYGGRGISIDPRWNDFLTFVADMGERPDGMSIERINNDLGYSPENCKWGDSFEQNNNRSNNIYATHNGITQTLQQWDRKLGFKCGTVNNRINRSGWSVEDALNRPLRHSPQRGSSSVS